MLLQLETVPYLIDNPEVGYVQARWIFANPDECYLTKVSPVQGPNSCAFALGCKTIAYNSDNFI